MSLLKNTVVLIGIFWPAGRPGNAAFIAACEGWLPVTMPLVVDDGPAVAVAPANSMEGKFTRAWLAALVGSE